MYYVHSLSIFYLVKRTKLYINEFGIYIAIYIFISHSGIADPLPNHYAGKGLLYDIILICTRGMQLNGLNDVYSVCHLK